MPFLSVGTFGLLVAIALFFVVPDVQANKRDSPDDDSKVLNLRGIAKVANFQKFSCKLINISKHPLGDLA